MRDDSVRTKRTVMADGNVHTIENNDPWEE